MQTHFEILKSYSSSWKIKMTVDTQTIAARISVKHKSMLHIHMCVFCYLNSTVCVGKNAFYMFKHYVSFAKNNNKIKQKNLKEY